jgi:hypothetical protein
MAKRDSHHIPWKHGWEMVRNTFRNTAGAWLGSGLGASLFLPPVMGRLGKTGLAGWVGVSWWLSLS